MKNKRILIYGEKSEYTEALCQYLISRDSKNKMGYTVVRATGANDIHGEKESFDFVIKNESDCDDKKSPDICCKEKTIIISEDEDNRQKDGFFYKYQSMEVLLECIGRERTENTRNVAIGKTRIIGIYSPVFHELAEPFALSLCNCLSEHGEVILVDLWEISILEKLMESGFEGDLIDLLYSIESGMNPERYQVEPYIKEFEGFNILAPISSPSQIAYIDEQSWMDLIELLTGCGYSHVVVLFGGLVKGMNELLGLTDKLVVLGKEGDYYRMMEDVFMDYLGNLDLLTKAVKVHLPLSANNLKGGSYRLESLINGHMKDFIRKEIPLLVGNTGDKK